MPNLLKKALSLAGNLAKGKLTVAGVITTAVGAILTGVLGSGHSVVVPMTIVDTLSVVRDTTVVATSNSDPFASIEILIELCKQAWPHILVIVGFLSTVAGFFRKAGAHAEKESNIWPLTLN